jgi:murein tripeptide amidase MpaA
MNQAKAKSVADLELSEEITTKLQDAQVFNAFELLNAQTEELAKSANLEVKVVEELKKEVRNRLWTE